MSLWAGITHLCLFSCRPCSHGRIHAHVYALSLAWPWALVPAACNTHSLTNTQHPLGTCCTRTSLREGLDAGILLGEHEGVVGPLDLLEPLLGLLCVLGVLVGMPQLGQPPAGARQNKGGV